MYVVAPEKFVARALFESGGLDKEDLLAVAVVGGVLLDLCGLAALAAGPRRAACRPRSLSAIASPRSGRCS